MNQLNTTIKNVIRRKNQAFLTVIITMIAVTVFTALLSVIYTSQEALNLSEERMGADILIYPDTANANGTDIVFTGISEMVYMDETAVLDAIPADLTEQITVQFFLETLPGAGCCEVGDTIRIVGYDCQSDFLLGPWSQNGAATSLSDTEMIIGSNISYEIGDTMAVLNHQFTITDKLYPTGTGMDESIFLPINTLRKMASKSFPVSSFGNRECNTVVSSIFVKLADGVTEDAFLKELNVSALHATAETISSMKASLSDQNRMIGYFLLLFGGTVVLMTALSLYIQFHNWIAGRKREVGYLKSIGFTTREVLIQFLIEIWIQCLMGCIPGVILGILSQSVVRSHLQELFVMPGVTLTLPMIISISGASILFALIISGTTALPNAWVYASTEPYAVISKGELD